MLYKNALQAGQCVPCLDADLWPSQQVCVDGLYREKPVQKPFWSGWVGGGWRTGQMLYVESPGGKCAATEGRGQGKRADL